MRCLLDINVLVALVWPNHPHHGAARTWFGRDRNLSWATTPASQMGFVRLSCNPIVVAAQVTPLDASRVLAGLTRQRDHEFWPDHTEVQDVDWSTTTGYRQVPDSHLLSVAARNGGLVATLDRSMAARGGSGLVKLIESCTGGR